MRRSRRARAATVMNAALAVLALLAGVTGAQDRDLLPILRRVQCPVLVLRGTTDRAVPPDDARILAETLRVPPDR